jgi:acyl dehydratase
MSPPKTIDLPSIKARSWTLKTTYTVSDIITYNLALGSSGTSLPLVYESHPQFHALPTFGCVPIISIMGLVHNAMFDFLPDFKGHNHVHGEHFLKVENAYPVPKGHGEVRLESTARVLDVVARKTGVLVCVEIVTRAEDGKVICVNEWTGFVMRTPTSGASLTSTPRGERTAIYPTPTRAPDKVSTHQTTPEQAALYRAASGDLNPLHIDPETAKSVGFKAPILTGTCTLGIAVRSAIEAFVGEEVGRFQSVRVRLSGPVYATLGERIRTEMWSEEGGKVLFRMVVDRDEEGKERTVLSQGCVMLKGSGETRL